MSCCCATQNDLPFNLWERSAEQCTFKDCWCYDVFHNELQKNKGCSVWQSSDNRKTW